MAAAARRPGGGGGGGPAAGEYSHMLGLLEKHVLGLVVKMWMWISEKVFVTKFIYKKMWTCELTSKGIGWFVYIKETCSEKNFDTVSDFCLNIVVIFYFGDQVSSLRWICIDSGRISVGV